ncbi:leucine-rich repeat-containing protein 23, partial [Exaiptasia diaphana]|uniref:Leucine-rich repeat protein n=1 Tax=Exaiptasia diaphana TaxID=2652724 RepID=A0A913YUX9_EXADI
FIHLRYVDISGNQLTDISSINSLTHLLTLKCDRNKLPSAKLDELPYLQIASFANNKIMDTEGISHPLLEHLNLSCKHLYPKYWKVKSTSICKCIVLIPENPVSDEDDYRIEVLITLRRLERLDKDEYTDDERQEAEEIYEQRRQEEAAAQGTQEIIQTDEDD